MRKTKFGREITVILLVKLLVIYSLWSICFKNNKQIVAGERFAKQIFGLSIKHD